MSNRIHSPEVATAILKLNESIKDPHKQVRLLGAISSMGPGCLFDDFESQTEVSGALKVFDWIQAHIDYKS